MGERAETKGEGGRGKSMRNKSRGNRDRGAGVRRGIIT